MTMVGKRRKWEHRRKRQRRTSPVAAPPADLYEIMSDISTGDEASPRGSASFPPRDAVMASKRAINSNSANQQLDVSVIDLASDTESD